ncbi:MAG: 30S ribosomal protein S8 [Myxococcota bacterium]|nr:30S ribosomal protein S8 [Myxococcota bacterium]MDW8363235.1 30S ribosomal protein S8 [Myxococcales bacterium]
MMTDPIADMLTRLRNATLARHERVQMPHSRLREQIARILRDEGYVSDVHVETGPRPRLTVVLKYGRDRQPAIAGLRRRSRPGRRVYVGYESIPRVLAGMGIAILSTSRGVMTDRQARASRVGGELLCEVW